MTQAYQEAASISLHPIYNRRSTDPGNPTFKPALEDRVLNFKQACAMLVLSPASLYRLVETRKIACYKVNSRLRFRTIHLQAWLEQHYLAPVEDWNAPSARVRMASSQKVAGGAQ